MHASFQITARLPWLSLVCQLDFLFNLSQLSQIVIVVINIVYKLINHTLLTNNLYLYVNKYSG